MSCTSFDMCQTWAQPQAYSSQKQNSNLVRKIAISPFAKPDTNHHSHFPNLDNTLIKVMPDLNGGVRGEENRLELCWKIVVLWGGRFVLRCAIMAHFHQRNGNVPTRRKCDSSSGRTEIDGLFTAVINRFWVCWVEIIIMN